MSARDEVLAAADRLVGAFGRHDKDAYFAGFAPDATFCFYDSPSVCTPERRTRSCGRPGNETPTSGCAPAPRWPATSRCLAMSPCSPTRFTPRPAPTMGRGRGGTGDHCLRQTARRHLARRARTSLAHATCQGSQLETVDDPFASHEARGLPGQLSLPPHRARGRSEVVEVVSESVGASRSTAAVARLASGGRSIVSHEPRSIALQRWPVDRLTQTLGPLRMHVHAEGTAACSPAESGTGSPDPQVHPA